MKEDDLSQVLEQVRKVAEETVPQGGHVFLFGSRARGDFRADSDWDFLVILQKDKIDKSDYDCVAYPLTLLGWKLGPDFDNDSPSRACVTREDLNQWPDGLLLGCRV